MSQEGGLTLTCTVHDYTTSSVIEMQNHNATVEHTHTVAGKCQQCGEECSRTFTGLLTSRTPLICRPCMVKLAEEAGSQ